MPSYLQLTDREWLAIERVMPTPRRGPRRPHDRAVCAALLFAAAASVSVESLPLGRFPDAMFLRSTEGRWRRDGTLEKLFEVGAPAQSRMAKEYDAHITRLSLNRVKVSGRATATLPRWTHVRRT